MFNKDFYPTPHHLIEEMLEGVKIKGVVFMEPEAGKCDIVDYLNKNDAKEVLTCELEPKLAEIVKTRSRFLAPDFLTVKKEEVSHVQCIVMNPPFSADEHHILHAWEIAPEGCQIIALCNYETYGNYQYSTKRRQLKSIIDEHGYIVNHGDVFAESEHTTNVEIGLIRIQKPGSAGGDEFEGFFMDEDEEAQGIGIMPYNAVRDLVNRYVGSVKLFQKQLDIAVEMNNLNFCGSKIAVQCSVDEKPKKLDEFKKDLQKNAWNLVFRMMNMEKYTTKGLKADINKFVETQEKIPFTMRNIYKMVEIVAGTHKSRMDKAIMEVFEKLTKHYHDNRYNLEGWKTNSHYLLGEKFILTYMTNIKYSGGMDLRYNGNYELMDDFNKALCYITGTDYETMPSLWSYFHRTLTPADAQYDDTLPRHHNQYFKYEFGKWYQWGFFMMKGYKKGTMHFKFVDSDVWAMVNQQVARIKGYPLPEAMKPKKAV